VLPQHRAAFILRGCTAPQHMRAAPDCEKREGDMTSSVKGLDAIFKHLLVTHDFDTIQRSSSSDK
jgi:hypothetical protein